MHVPHAPDRPGAQVIAWPAGDRRRDELVAAGVPRLLVLEAGVAPPPAVDDLEDWIWLPADERDVFARLRSLASRHPGPGPGIDTVRIDARGRVWFGGRSAQLPRAEAAILTCLADPPERLCSRESLATAAWGEVPHARRSLDSRVFSLRRRIAPLGLAVTAVRGSGFVLTEARGGTAR